MLEELSKFVRGEQGVWLPLPPGSEHFPDMYSRFLPFLPDFLGPCNDVNTFHVVYSVKYIGCFLE